MVNWEKQTGRYPRDPRYGHRVGCNYTPIYQNDLYSTTDGFIANLSHPGITALEDQDTADIVFVIGGSAAMGYGVRNEDTLSANLQRIIDKKFPNSCFKVVNAACAGWASWTEFMYLSLELIHYRPRYIVHITGWNDFVHSSIGSKRNNTWSRNHDRSIEDIFKAVEATRDIRALLSLYYDQSYLIHKIRYLYYRIRGKHLSASDIRWGHQNTVYKFRPAGVYNLIKNIISANSVCIGHSINYSCILQPVVYLSQNSPYLTDELIDWAKKYPGFANALELFYSTLKINIESQTNIKYLDLSSCNAFGTDSFIDHCHLSSIGNEVLAEEIFNHIF